MCVFVSFGSVSKSAHTGARTQGLRLIGATLYRLSYASDTEATDTMAEWSKAGDSSSLIFGCAGSNPARVTFVLVYDHTAAALIAQAKVSAAGIEPATL